MQRVIVTVKREDEARVRDLEVPADLPAEQLARLISEALRWQKSNAGTTMSYRIEAQPLGRAMQPAETLAGAGVWDGSWLVLHPVESAAPAVASAPAPVARPQPPAISPPIFAPVAPRPEVVPAPPPAPMPLQPAVAWNPPPVPASGASAPNAPVNPIASGPPAIQPAPPTVTGWRSLGLDLPPTHPAPQQQAFQPQIPQPQTQTQTQTQTQALQPQQPQIPQPPPPPPPQPQPQPQEAPAEKKSSSFVWKQLDE